MDRLAVDGGMPVRTEKIYYGRQWIDEEDVKAVSEVLTSDFVTCGPKVAELERALAEYTGVITTPLTFAASANCALYCGAQPVFADVDPKTYNIDPASIESHITEKTKAVVAVDFTGQAAKIREIREI